MRISGWLPTAMAMGLWLGAGSAQAHESVYAVTSLVSDGSVPAASFDPSLVNAWGLVATATSPWWVSDNGSGMATIYSGTGVKNALAVTVPGDPTGIVANATASFVVTDGAGHSGPARFIFASEDGSISGWNPTVPPPPTSHSAFVAVNSGAGAVYKGLAIGTTPTGPRLYATNFRAGTVDVFDGTWHAVTAAGAFEDKGIPHDFAPFGISNIAGTIYVTYAKQDHEKHDDVAGHGNGFVDAYDLNGTLIRRVASRGALNSPWGIVLAPANFGSASGDLLVGNFGDGKINVFDLATHHAQDEAHPRGALQGERHDLVIGGLWGLSFGNGAAAGPTNTLYFTAGPGGESGGQFGNITVDADDVGGHDHDADDHDH